MLRRRAIAALACALATVVVAPHARAQQKGAQALLRAAVPSPPSRQRNHDEDGGRAPLQIVVGPWNGWPRCYTLSNGRAEVVIVPEIGRIMEFREIGGESPFWHDPALHGETPEPQSEEWRNFGGDKTWPAPQSDWPKQAGRAWPPPPGFDAAPVEVSIRREGLVLRSATDPRYGIQVERVISLDRAGPEMTITTTYRKVDGPPVTTAVWIITQLKDPVALFAPVPPQSVFEKGYTPQSGDTLPARLEIDGRLLSCARDPSASAKIGLDAGRLLWVGESDMLLISSPRLPGLSYPDNGSSAEIYTNPDPRAYIELEMLGPLKTLEPGDELSQTNTYTLIPRARSVPSEDARRVLGLPHSNSTRK